MNNQYLSFIGHFAVVWFLCASPVSAQIDVDVVSESIVRVRAYDDHKVVVEGSGFVVNEEGYVLTNAHLLEKAEGLTVLSLKTGAEVVAQRTFASRDMNLALLHVQGLNLPPLSLSEQGADVGRAVQTLRFGATGAVQLSHGTIGTYQDILGKKTSRPVAHLLQHNALITAKAFGMPLFNECGDVVAINLPDPGSGSWPFRKAKPKGTIFALRSGDIITALEEREIAHTVVEAECLSAVERAERDRKAAADSLKVAKAKADSASKAAEKAKAQADSVSKAAKKAKAKEKVARRAAEQAKARADSASKAAADSLKATKTKADSLKMAKARADSASKVAADSLKAAKTKADSLKTVEEKAQAKADSLKVVEEKAAQRLQWGIAAGAGLVLLALLGWWLSSRRKKEQLQSAESRLSEAEQTAEAARQAAAKAPQPAPFRCLLEGQDSTGRPFALTISALALGDRAGVTLGRSPANAEFIVDHEEVSREHVRLTCADGEFYAEDLNALNGTKVNGRLLNSREQVLLQNNDRLEIGPVVFTVRLVQE
ncbi:MAG: FHA domain-containing protein [Gemmatimonadetes bacterium]|nr:FHA domain-containing protein [Gemmatimonadota bacterium]